MLELRRYTRCEIAEMFGIRLSNNNNEAIKNRLNRYGVEYNVIGRGAGAEFDITNIEDEFKLYCLTDLKMSANTDFNKFLYFMYYFLNDETFRSLPDEMLETKMDERNTHISRQTISGYKRVLESRNLFHSSYEYIYYFARKEKRILTDKETYNKAWWEYWNNRDEGADAGEAISAMCAKYGGVAMKQSIMEANGIYLETINRINDMVCNAIENELE